MKKELNEAIFERDHHSCVSCGRWVQDGEKAHHEPLKSHGGKDIPQNLVVLCGRCHYNRHNCGHVGPLIRDRCKKHLNDLYGGEYANTD